MNDLQRANIWKRISAFLFDIILLGIIILAVALLLSAIFGYTDHCVALSEKYDAYAAEYGVQFNLSASEYEELTDEEKARYEEAATRIQNDAEMTYEYNMVINLSLVIISVSTLVGYLALEFAVPMALKNGQTLGKKIFGVALMRTDGVRLRAPALFIRTILGKYAVETMIPIYMVLLIIIGRAGWGGIAALVLFLILEIVLMAATRTNSTIHDILAGTVAIDYASQKIFDTPEELIEYKKKLAAERAEKQPY